MNGRWMAVALLVPIIIGAISGCVDIETDGDLEFTDDMGDTIYLNGTPERVITLSPALTELVFAIGGGDLVVACDETSDHPDGVQGLQRVFSWDGMDLEAIIAAEPDIIFMDWTLDVTGDDHRALKEIGLNVYRVYPTSMDDIIQNIIEIGDILDLEEGARVLSDDIEIRLNAVEEEASAIVDRPGVLHISYYDGSSDPWVLTESTFSGGMIDRAGGRCVMTDGSGKGITVSIETIIVADPDIIFTSQSSSWPTSSRSLILSDERLQDVEAVKNGAVYDVEGDLVDRTGPRMIDGLELFQEHITAYAEGA